MPTSPVTEEISAEGRRTLKPGAAVGKMRGEGSRAAPQQTAVLGALVAEAHQSPEEIRARYSGVGPS